MIFEKAQADEKLQGKVSDSQDLLGLLDHPGWAVLKQYVATGSESLMRSLTARLMIGEDAASMQRQIDYYRGAQDFAKAILRYPDVAVANLEAIAQKLYAAHLEAEAAKAYESSPYIDATEEVA